MAVPGAPPAAAVPSAQLAAPAPPAVAPAVLAPPAALIEGVDTSNEDLAEITELFSTFTIPEKYTSISLPNGSKREVKLIGEVRLSDSVTLAQALKTDHIEAVGKQVGRLYVLNKDSFSVSVSTNERAFSCYVIPRKASMWHRRLGHSSAQVPTGVQSLDILPTQVADLAAPQSPITQALPSPTQHVPAPETCGVDAPATTDSTPSHTALRRSTRARVPPVWMQDFSCNSVTISPVTLSPEILSCLTKTNVQRAA
ncbi:hypothetical protein Salat_1413500 [Sesamum alatum]|uniref:GAG-pre-integrase domain-containing protein n=1 Tax=Sesamum alatum TaxID=300844 RepID=A0AAE1YAI4_9LAMI|nr:hypothetical protein Salat_1413500 [Sesamum alatum]